MKLNLNINGKVDKNFTIDQLKLVLFRSMLKLQQLATINCPVDKGRLRNSINLKPAIEGYSAYRLTDGVEYGVDVEYGTAPHLIVPKVGKALRFKIDGKFVFAKSARHPGTEAQPFFRPALFQVNEVWVKRYMDMVLSKR